MKVMESLSPPQGVNVIRVVYDFLPRVGGSITMTAELSKRINDRIRGQTIIAPNVDGSATEDGVNDRLSSIPVVRLHSPFHGVAAASPRIPFQPITLTLYGVVAVRAARRLASTMDTSTVVHVHGLLLGSIIQALIRLIHLDVPVVITQDSANPFRISRREEVSTVLAMSIMKAAKPSCVLVVDDGMGIDDYSKSLEKAGVPWRRVFHAVSIPPEKDTARTDGVEFTLVSTSRLTRFKRVDLAVDAFSQFLENHSGTDAVFLIAGSGDEKANLEQQILRLGAQERVKMVGEKTHEEIEEMIRKSDVVIGTSLHSNLNLSMIEAMAAGVPVIAFDTGEMTKLIEHMKDGVLVAPGDVSGLSNALSLLLERRDIRESMGCKARDRILRERSWDTRIREELQCYQDVLRRADHELS